MKNISKEIKVIKEFYGISYNTLHHITGIGITNLRHYANGSIPNKSNFLLIQSILYINGFNTLFRCAKGQLKNYVIEKIEKKIEEEIQWRNCKVSEYKYELFNLKLKQ